MPATKQLSVEYDVRASVEQDVVPDDQDTSDYPELDIELHDLKMQR
jgi:hypothetical protein